MHVVLVWQSQIFFGTVLFRDHHAHAGDRVVVKVTADDRMVSKVNGADEISDNQIFGEWRYAVKCLEQPRALSFAQASIQ